MFRRILQKLQGSADMVELPGFTPIGLVRQGSMSVIYKATDRTTGRLVAIKLHKPEARKTIEKLESRFRDLNEGQITASFDHPNVVKCIQHGDLGGTHFVVMEYLEGMTLAGLTAGDSHKLDGRRLAFVRQAAAGIEHVHARKFIHRDFCLKNLFVTTDNRLKVIDFGLATPLLSTASVASRMGTVEILAPEVLRREPSDQRVDIFAWGVVAYQVFSGHWPFESTDQHQTLSKILNVRPTPIERRVPALPPEVAALIMRCLDKDPSKRPAGLAGAEAILAKYNTLAI